MPALPLKQEAAMQTYNFRWLDDHGKAVQTFTLEFPDDVTALESATKRCWDHAIDIFQSDRYVAHVKKGNAALVSTDRTSL